jgi:hypothetical protein
MDPGGTRFDAALENARKFFVGDAHLQKALRKLARLLDEDGISYAIAGAMALNAFEGSCRRARVDASLPRDMVARLDPSVRPKYLELWAAAQSAERE